MAFSGALTLNDLDDFLTPSQACIIPVRGAKAADPNAGPTEIQIDAQNNYYEVQTYDTASGVASGSGTVKAAREAKQLEKAEISLNDCLACSGCITSTESLLITLQSQTEVFDFLHATTSSKRTSVLTISPQTLASLAAAHKSRTGSVIPLDRLLRRIRHFLTVGLVARAVTSHTCGCSTSDASTDPQNPNTSTDSSPEHSCSPQLTSSFNAVWDTTFARHLALQEQAREYDERRDGKGKLPMLASACPGWVCYAEKAHGDLLPLMSDVRSPMAVMGGLVKGWWAARQGLKPEEIYHVTVMPCYDKKLEASRSDFYSSVHQTRDVDCVLTTGELDVLLRSLDFDASIPVPDEEAPSESLFPDLLSHPGTSSGSYLHTLLSHIASTYSNPTELHVRPIRNSDDNVEFLLQDIVTGMVIFKGAKCYGFRNLQNLVRKLGNKSGKAGKLQAAVAARRRNKASAASSGTSTPVEGLSGEDRPMDFVEVMACPGGCVNGGGQIKPAKAVQIDEEGFERPMADDGVDEGMRWSTKEWVANVEAVYWDGVPTPPASPPASIDALAADILQDVINGNVEITGSTTLNTPEYQGDRWEFLRTRYRKVESDLTGTLAGVKCVRDDASRWPTLRSKESYHLCGSCAKAFFSTTRQLSFHCVVQRMTTSFMRLRPIEMDFSYEEEIRKRAVMVEVLPDAQMWKTWEEKEAPLRRGRGWYPALDRHFLELLVISEIHCLSHPLPGGSPTARATQIHRHATRVRRVASERIGMERLRAYCDRVKEAFESYIGGGWGVAVHPMDDDDRGRPVERRVEEHTDRSERSSSSSRSRSPSPTHSSKSSDEGPKTPNEDEQSPFSDDIKIDQPTFNLDIDLDAMDVDAPAYQVQTQSVKV